MPIIVINFYKLENNTAKKIGMAKVCEKCVRSRVRRRNVGIHGLSQYRAYFLILFKGVLSDGVFYVSGILNKYPVDASGYRWICIFHLNC